MEAHTRTQITIVLAAGAAIIFAIAAFLFVSAQPGVPDGGALDTNVGDSQPGNPDGATPPPVTEDVPAPAAPLPPSP